VIHAAVGGFLLRFPSEARRVAPPVYRVQLVAAPRPEPEARRAPAVVDRPAEQPGPAVPIAPRPAARRPAPTPSPTPPTPTTTQREPSPRTTPQAEPLPGVTPSTGADPATVEVEGLEFPYPEYLRNIVAQVYRRWERPTGHVVLKAEVFFLVHRDGSISNLRFVARSGSFAFDLEAQGAIEAAAGAFGPLPEGFADDVLPVSFFFDPQKVR
jgi:outer membrane biosynthesis protein TonB